MEEDEPQGNIHTTKENRVFNPDKLSVIIAEECKLEEDVFSMLYVAPLNSPPAIYAIVIFFFQISILLLALINLLTESTLQNPFNSPPYTPLPVKISEFIALLISVFLSNDMITALDLLLTPHSSEVTDVFPAATEKKRRISMLLQSIEGILTMMVAFLFIVQADDVLGLFLDFAAVAFVSELDNIAFILACKGYVPICSIRQTAKLIQNIHWEPRRSTSNALEIKKENNKVLGIILGVVYSLWIVNIVFQSQGIYYRGYCNRLYVELTKSYDFFGSMCRQRNETCPFSWYNSTAKITMLYDTTDFFLKYIGSYSSFNDVYMMVEKADNTILLYNDRPVYAQRGKRGIDGFGKNQPAGEIKYCKQENAWVFAIQNISKGANADDCSWLLKSPKTDALVLDDVPEQDWTVFTGKIEEEDVDITCIECEDNIRSEDQTGVMSCNFHGTCDFDTKECKCNNMYMGHQCTVCGACSILELVGFDDKLLTHENITKFKRLDDDTGTAFELKGRPVFYFDHHLNPHSNSTLSSDEELVVISYIGEKWAIFNQTEIDVGYDVDPEEVRVNLLAWMQTFHSQWDLNLGLADLWFLSLDKTAATTPENVKYWVNVEKNEEKQISFICPGNENFFCDASV